MINPELHSKPFDYQYPESAPSWPCNSVGKEAVMTKTVTMTMTMMIMVIIITII